MHLPRVAIIFNAAHAYDRDLMRGIIRYANLHGPWLFFQDVPDLMREGEEVDLISRLLQWRPDGVILKESHLLHELEHLHIPLIVSPHNEPFDRYVNLISDNQGLGREVAVYFQRKGFQHFAFCGYPGYKWSDDRLNGYAGYLTCLGYTVHEFTRGEIGLLGNWQNELQHIANWLLTLPRPAAVFACTDEYAWQVIQAAAIHGLRIPSDLAVMGADNDEFICSLSNPAISSIDQNAEWAGYMAARCMEGLLRGLKPENNQILAPAGKIVTRMSTHILAANDRDVQKALQYIADRAPAGPVSVDEVAAATSITRRVLEMRFRSTLRCTITDEIRRVRMSKIKELIANTALSLSQVAFEAGFASYDNFTRYFKASAGITPSDFRKTNLI